MAVDKLKRFIDVYVPVTTCTLRCHYCYITHHRLFGGPLPRFSYSPEKFRNALSQKRLGGVCMFNFCGGGETLLVPEIIDYVRALLDEGHYVMIVTNATVDQAFDKMERWPKEILERLFFKFSYHYLELKKHNLFERFFRNVKRMRDAGASFTLEATPSDELVPYINEMKEQSMREVGAWCHITVPRLENDMGVIPLMSKMDMDEFSKIWRVFDSKMFEYKVSVFGKRQKGFCYAGDWTALLQMRHDTCTMRQCYGTEFCQDVLRDTTRPLKFRAVGHGCKMPHCFNSHAFLTFGAIPTRDDPTYADMRNKVCVDASEWLGRRMKAFMSQRLRDNNKEYSILRRTMMDICLEGVLCLRCLRRLAGRLKRFLMDVFHH